MPPKRCLTGADPKAPAEIPHFTTAYYNGEAILVIAEALIRAHQELSWIPESDYKLVCFWKRLGGTSKGKPVLGRAAMASGLVGHLTQATFQIVMSADHCRELTNLELEAAIYHQLLHCHEQESEDSEGETTYSPAIRSHDFEGFLSEVTRYGFWTMELRSAAEPFAKQLKLPLNSVAKVSSEPADELMDTSFPSDRAVPDDGDGSPQDRHDLPEWTERDETVYQAEIAAEEYQEGPALEPDDPGWDEGDEAKRRRTVAARDEAAVDATR